MSAKHKVVLWDAANGGIETGITITLKYGSTPINGRTPGATVSTYTETPATSGAYEISIPETNQYTVVVSGAVAGEYTDIWLLGDDAVTTPKLAGTGASQGASLVGVRDTAGRITATTVEDALAELAGSGRTTETIKTAYDDANTAKAKLVNATLGNVNTLVGFGGVVNASSLHLHNDVYFTETELSSTGVSNLRLSESGSLKVVSGGATGDLVIGSGADTSSNMGDITLDAHNTTANKSGGKVLVDIRPGAGGSVGSFKVNKDGTEYNVTTDYELGTLDFSSTRFLSSLVTGVPGLATNAFRELDYRVGYALDQINGSNVQFFVAYSRDKSQTLGSIAAASALAWGTWTNTGSYKEAFMAVMPMPEIGVRRIRVYYDAWHSTGSGGGLIRASINGPLNRAQATVDNLSSDPSTYLEFEYNTSSGVPVEIRIEIGTTSGTITLSENILILYI